MDILTNIKLDHKNIDTLLQELMDSIKGENNKHTNHSNDNQILLEDLLEEIREHIQAEKTCFCEMLSKKGEQSHPQRDPEIILKFLSSSFYENNMGLRDKDVEHKLKRLRTLFQEHSNYIENIIFLASNKWMSPQESEALSINFEEEKINTLLKTITYA